MPTDLRYDANDRVADAAGNYGTTPGQADAMLREMSCWLTTIDGLEYGNGAYAEAERGQDTSETRERIRRHFERVGQRYVDSGGIRDLVVTVDDPNLSDGVAIRVVCYDIMRSQQVDTALPVIDLG